MLEGLGAERLWLKLQAQEQQARHTLEKEAHIRQETYGRYDLARQWYSNQRQPQGIAKGLAQLAGLETLECVCGGKGWRRKRASTG